MPAESIQHFSTGVSSEGDHGSGSRSGNQNRTIKISTPSGQQIEEIDPKLEPIYNRLAIIDQKVDRIEQAINAILQRRPILQIITDNDGAEASRDSSAGNARTDKLILNIAAAKSLEKPTKHLLPSNAPQYVYSPLDAKMNEIRLIVLHDAADLTDPVTADLITVSLDDLAVDDPSIEYIALSYTWNETSMTHTVGINGQKFQVTKNLETALRYMRDASKEERSWYKSWKKHSKHWWVDQICINQSDIEERNSQVMLMQRIFKTAAAVSVWLGEESEDSNLALDLLNRLGSPPTHAPGERRIVYPKFPAEQTSRHWKALRALFRRQWWERSWIRQEIALSRKVMLYCGKATCEMDVASNAVKAMQYIETLEHEPTDLNRSDASQTMILPAHYHANKLAELRKDSTYGSSWIGLAQLLPHTRGCKASDPRDLVYSILGLANPEDYEFSVNYRLPLREVLINATRDALTKKHGLVVLGACQNLQRSNGLPSWVPNLLDGWKAHPFEPAKLMWPSDLKVTLAESDTLFVGESLFVKGFMFGKIAMICDDAVEKGAGVEQLITLYHTWKAFVAEAHKSNIVEKSEGDNYCTSRRKDKFWLRLLSAFEDNGDRLRYSSDNELIAEKEIDLNRTQEYRHVNLKLTRSYLVPEGVQGNIHPFWRIISALRKYGIGRRLCISTKGVIGLFPAEVQIDDSIAIFHGALFPYVIRAVESDESYLLVGEGFVPRYMGGTAERLAADEKLKTDSFIRLV